MHFPLKTASKVQNMFLPELERETIEDLILICAAGLPVTHFNQSQAADLWFSNGENPL